MARDAAGGMGGIEEGYERILGGADSEAVLVQTNHPHEFENNDDLYRSRSASRRKKCQPRPRTSRRCSRCHYFHLPA